MESDRNSLRDYSTIAILFAKDNGNHSRPFASRAILRTEEFGAGIGKVLNTSTTGSNLTSMLASDALSSYQILPAESAAIPYGSDRFPDGLSHILNFLSASVSRPSLPPPESVK